MAGLKNVRLLNYEPSRLLSRNFKVLLWQISLLSALFYAKIG